MDSNRRLALAPLPILFVLAITRPLPASNWPQWRGVNQDGLSDETGLPLQWDEKSGVAWKVELPGWGTSTPAVWGDAVLVTSERDGELLLLRISKRTGALEWERRIGSGKAERMDLRLKSEEERRRQKFHATHNLASPSPTTDGDRVIVHFGNGDLASYTLDGKEEWKRNLQDDHGPYTIWWGHANSPVLHGDLVISACLQDSLTDLPGKPSESYLVAHEKRTGKQVWKTLRMTGAASEPCDSYITPVLHKTDGGMELIVMGGTQLDAYDPLTGRQIWRLPKLGGNRVITGPTVARGMVFATVGMRGSLLGVKLAGRQGEAPQEDIVWRHAKSTPDSPSPVVVGETVFIISDGGIATALDASTGKAHWSERLEGEYRASPVAADGRVYFVSMKGLTTVIAASTKFAKLAECAIDDEIVASPAIADGRILLRGRKWLYCVTKK